MKRVVPVLVILVMLGAALPVKAAPVYQSTRTLTLGDIYPLPTNKNVSSESVVCEETAEGGIRCDFVLSVFRGISPTDLGRSYWVVEWEDPNPSAGYYFMAVVDASGEYWYDDPCICNLDFMDEQVFSVGTAPAAGNGYVTVTRSGVDAGKSVTLRVSTASEGGASFSGYFILSPVPILSDCEENYLVLTSDTYEIYPDIEFPIGMVGDPEPVDEQIYPTVIGHVYRVEIGGGDWNDGTDDRRDVSISWDGTEWTPLSAVPSECTKVDEEGNIVVVYIVAESETFHIRANDEPEQFADNFWSIPEDPTTYTIGLTATQASPPCESQFAWDDDADWVATVQVHGDNEPGVLATDELVQGEWYAIVVANGAWQDEGAPPDRYDMEFYNGPPEFAIFDVPYTDLTEGNQNVFCQSEDGKISFIQAKNLDLYLRVNDTPNEFDANTGVLGVNIFRATFTRTQQMCEMRFQRENLVSSGNVEATQEAGKVFAFALGTPEIHYGGALIPGAWYYLETTGGPWQWKGSIHQATGISYDMAVHDGRDDGDWMPLAEWDKSPCIVQLDGLGHLGVYFQIPEAAAVEWKLRVDDTDVWFNNGGSMSWNLYGATDLGLTPVDDCDYIYDPDHPVSGDWVSAKSENGEWMQIYAGHTYALVLNGSEYYWQEEPEGPPLRDMQISNDDGRTWYDLPDGFGGTLCYMENGYDTTIFLRAGQGQNWKIRVDSESFSNNVGGMGYQLFEANPGDELDPWTSCFDGNVVYMLNSLTFIPVKDEEGIYINGTNILTGGNEIQLLQPTETYKLQIEEGPWTDGEGGNNHFDAAISADNGVTWYDLADKDNPNIICGDVDFVGQHRSVYFTVQEGQKWKIRVNDEEGEFTDNGGNLAYSLYSVSGEDVPPVDITIPPEVVNNVCTEPLVRPTSILEVSRWVEYARLGIQKYFAWCPGHTDIIMALLKALTAKEPFATLNEGTGLVNNVKGEITAYNWSPDSGQDFSILDKSPSKSYQMFNQYVLSPVSSTSPWETGILDITDFENFTMPASYTSCQQYLAPQAGARLAQGVCYASAVMLLTGASFWIQLILDISIGIFCVRAFWRTIDDTVVMMTGVSSMSKV